MSPARTRNGRIIDRIKQMERFKALYFCEGRKKPSLISLLPQD